MEHRLELLRELSQAHGVSGFEDEVREIIHQRIESKADEVFEDALGNLFAIRRGERDFTLMLDAHLDEIGLMINHIDAKGFLHFIPIGGWDPRILPTHMVEILTRGGKKYKGIIGMPPPHISNPKERKQVLEIEKLFIDVGAKSEEEVRRMGIELGDPATIVYPFGRLNGEYVLSKAFDNRAGCAILVEILERLEGKTPPVTVVCAFCVCEEVGLRGARAAAYRVRPDLALVVEGTIGAGTPGVPAQRQLTQMGRGVALTLADKRTIVRSRMIRALEELAKRFSIPFQYKQPGFGGTDAGEIHISREGVLTGIVAVPCRYIHSPCQLMNLGDYRATLELVEKFLWNCLEFFEKR
ncbi:MAG: M42 family peptidase [Planctomycetota bacterium]|nr:MAG: M42 family peptidase [Planctomycetota bacterium]